MTVPNSTVVKAGDMVFFSGITPTDDCKNIIGKGDIEVQTKEIIKRIEGYLVKINMTLEDLVFITVYLSDMKMYDKMNKAYSEIVK